MALTDFKYANGHNNTAGYVNVVTTTGGYAPNLTVDGTAPQRGPDVLVTLSQKVYRRGTRLHVWVFDVLAQSEFNALINGLLGNFTTDSRPITIRTQTEDGTFDDYNVTVVKPYPGTDYEIFNGFIRNLRITFRALSEV